MGPNMPPGFDQWNPAAAAMGMLPQGPLPMPGEAQVPLGPGAGVMPPPPQQWNPAGIDLAPPQAPPPQAPQVDRFGRDPEDVKAMLQERARQQYERNFGRAAPNAPASMAAQGQQGELNALIDRIHQARMGHMADTRARRRGQRS